MSYGNDRYDNITMVCFYFCTDPISLYLVHCNYILLKHVFCSIIGLYIGMVFVIGQFVRTLTSGGSHTIMFDELPNVDRLMKLCKDLYFVRENGELALEEELFAKLIYLYRCVIIAITMSHVQVYLMGNKGHKGTRDGHTQNNKLKTSIISTTT